MTLLKLNDNLFPNGISKNEKNIISLAGKYDITPGPLTIGWDGRSETCDVTVISVNVLRLSAAHDAVTTIEFIRTSEDRDTGRFIVFDGPDGASKSTQISVLKATLEALGHDVIVTREPGGSHGAEEVRNLLVNGSADRWDGLSELLMFTAARRNHIETVVKPALDAGKIVLCDRFVASTVAYQGYGQGVPLETIEIVTKLAIGDFSPDLTILMFIHPELGRLRSAQRRGAAERFESFDEQFQNRVSNAYRMIASADDRDILRRCVPGYIHSIHVEEHDSVPAVTEKFLERVKSCILVNHRKKVVVDKTI